MEESVMVAVEMDGDNLSPSLMLSAYEKKNI